MIQSMNREQVWQIIFEILVDDAETVALNGNTG